MTGAQPRRVVITGATGALGRALVVAAQRRWPGVPILGLARSAQLLPGAEIQAGDITTTSFAEVIRAGDLVFHLAAFVHRYPRTPEEVRELHEVNHHASARLASACREVGATLVMASTVAVAASSEYGKSKAAAEEAIRKLGEGGLSYSILRFPLLYGPHGRGNMERLLRAIRAGRYWPIGDPATPKSCLYVDDAARALVRASDGALGGTYTAAPEVAPTLGQIHDAAYAAVGRRAPRYAIPRGAAILAASALQRILALVRRRVRLSEQIETLTSAAAFDGSSFARATGFRAEISLVEGMTRTARSLD